MALPPPFVSGSDAALAAAGTLQTELTTRINASKFKAELSHLGIALVDLTSVGEDPDPSGSLSVQTAANARWEAEVAVGSLSKIAIMFAAFRLRERVTVAAAGVAASASDVDDMVEKIVADWKPIVSRKIAKSPFDFPDLKRICDFAASSPWKPQFKGSTKSWEQLDKFHETSAATISGLPFMDRLRLAIRWSDNMASGSCVRDMGFQFLNGSLGEGGFAENRRNGVLWLGGDFGFSARAPIMGAPPWDQARNATWVRANARGIASYLTLLWTNRLVDRDSSREMRDILVDRGVGYQTYMGIATPNVVRSWSKIGILTGSISEGVIIETRSPKKAIIRYAAVGLSAVRTEALEELASIFYETVSALH